MHWLEFLLVAPLALLVLAVRIRRKARRIYRGTRIRIRLLAIVAVACLFPTLRVTLTVVRDPAHLSGVAVGVVLGVALGLAGILSAKFKRDQAGLWYKQDPYTGSVLLLLIVGWMSYRFYTGIFLRNGVFSAPVSPPWGLFAPAAILSFWYTNFAGILRHTVREDFLGASEHRPESEDPRSS